MCKVPIPNLPRAAGYSIAYKAVRGLKRKGIPITAKTIAALNEGFFSGLQECDYVEGDAPKQSPKTLARIEQLKAEGCVQVGEDATTGAPHLFGPVGIEMAIKACREARERDAEYRVWERARKADGWVFEGGVDGRGWYDPSPDPEPDTLPRRMAKVMRKAHAHIEAVLAAHERAMDEFNTRDARNAALRESLIPLHTALGLLNGASENIKQIEELWK